MFRKKDNDPVRPSGLAEKPAESSLARSDLSRPTPTQPEMPRRAVDLPTLGSSPYAGGGGDKGETKRLIVGRGISLSGEITACDRLIVEGSVQVTLNETKAIEITESGRFTNGKAEVDEAEISGVYEGELTVRNRLMIRATGQVKGNVRYGELELERGGRLSGSVSQIEPSTS